MSKIYSFIALYVLILVSSCGRYFQPLPQISCEKDIVYEKMEVRFYNLSNSKVNSFRVKWDFGDGTTSDEVNPRKIYDKAGKYIIKLTEYNAHKDSMSVYKEIEVFESEQKLICTLNMNNYELYDYNDNSGTQYNYFYTDLNCIVNDNTINYITVNGIQNNELDLSFLTASRTVNTDGNGCSNEDFINLFTGEKSLNTDSNEFVIFQVKDKFGNFWRNKCGLNDISNHVVIEIINNVVGDSGAIYIKAKATINTKLYRIDTGEEGNFNGEFYFKDHN